MLSPGGCESGQGNERQAKIQYHTQDTWRHCRSWQWRSIPTWAWVSCFSAVPTLDDCLLYSPRLFYGPEMKEIDHGKKTSLFSSLCTGRSEVYTDCWPSSVAVMINWSCNCISSCWPHVKDSWLCAIKVLCMDWCWSRKCTHYRCGPLLDCPGPKQTLGPAL